MAETAADERTPLLSTPAQTSLTPSDPVSESIDSPDNDSSSNPVGKDSQTGWLARWLASTWSPANRVLLASFLISLSFSFTQVSIFYVFRLMECDVYYSDPSHAPYTGHGDRCSINEIAAGTATQFSILGISTTFCGTWNLFISGHQVKQWGPRAALVIQTFVPAIRVATQIFGVYAGGQVGIWIIQVTQIITILGGPAGYILVVNTIAGEVVPPMQRTALFGQLQGCIMLGVATGYLLGGIVGDTFGIVRPFQVAFFLFLLSSLFARSAMPYISPESLSNASAGGPASPSKGGLAAFFEPLKVLWPQRIRLNTGRITSHYGVFFLCAGVFLGVLATGYAPVLLQMYATATFNFNQANNGWLMSGNSFMRAIFLIFMFPRIIDAGRAWFTRLAQEERSLLSPNKKPAKRTRTTSHIIIDDLPTEPAQFDAPTGTLLEEEPLLVRVPTTERIRDEGHSSGEESEDTATEDEKAAYAFDLFFLRWSLLVDGVITAGAALATQGWHMYLVTLLLPFGSGSAPAAKGVITSMCPQSQRTDALNAITLVENVARLATLGLFGFVFSALAATGQSHLTFYCNGAVAIVAMFVLMLSHFPPLDSELVDDAAEDEYEDEE